MDWEYEERVVSIVRGGEGCDEEYDEVSEFKQHLELGEEEACLEHEKLGLGWVLWRENERVQQFQIITLLEQIASHHFPPCNRVGRDWTPYIVQYWGVVKVEEGHHHLSSSHLPFAVGEGLSKGSCWYRKLCRGHVYIVQMELGDDQEQVMVIGGVGRAYQNKQPESTPDLRLYSTDEFPMRDEAARCGFRAYMTLPLFDVGTNQCVGVLEILSRVNMMDTEFLGRLEGSLQIAGFRSTHTPISMPIRSIFDTAKSHMGEISEILELVIETVPSVYIAQVCVPCTCMQMQGTDFRCMEIKYHFEGGGTDAETDEYLGACRFHRLQIDVSSFHSHLHTRDISCSISKNPLVHYAQRARMSYYFAISLQNTNHHQYTVLFYLREDEHDDIVQLVLRIVKMNLKTFKLVSGGEESQRHDATASACQSIESLNEMNAIFSESDFKTYLETVDSCCLQPSSGRWISYKPALGSETIKNKIKTFMNNIAVRRWKGYWIVQFWAPKMVEDRCYLQTSDQPFAAGCLDKGIASYRKKCMGHYYPVDVQANEEELGPPGRVFRNGNFEISPNLLCYTRKEFPIRNYALHCRNTGAYIALPIYDDDDELNHKCVGVLEFLGFDNDDLEDIHSELKAAKLCSTARTQIQSRFLAEDELPIQDQTINCRKGALTEIDSVLKLMCNNIPQLHKTYVWVSYGECVATSVGCLELALSIYGGTGSYDLMPRDQVHYIRTRKGMVGMVLVSENKSCFCPKLSAFGIADQPLLHYEMSDRRNACFAICLQSSHTGDLVYVVEFFLYQGPATYEYIRSFLNFLLPMMKHELRSFKLACGKELGEELVVEVVEFSNANSLEYSPASEQPQVIIPIKFKSVQYSQDERQHAQEQQTEECRLVASNLNTRERRTRKTSLHLSFEDLKPHFGKKLEDVAQELGVGRSTIKRACRDYGINRWPSKGKLKKNQSGGVSQLDTNTESTRHLIVEEEAKKVMIKVYGEDIIIFELRGSLQLTKLNKEVATRLKLGMTTFKLKYKDEDGDEILLTDDDDLQRCRKTQITMDKTYIQLYVR